MLVLGRVGAESLEIEGSKQGFSSGVGVELRGKGLRLRVLGFRVFWVFTGFKGFRFLGV